MRYNAYLASSECDFLVNGFTHNTGLKLNFLYIKAYSRYYSSLDFQILCKRLDKRTRWTLYPFHCQTQIYTGTIN